MIFIIIMSQEEVGRRADNIIDYKKQALYHLEEAAGALASLHVRMDEEPFDKIKYGKTYIIKDLEKVITRVSDISPYDESE